ncbi:hypothetical protein PsorP6_009357 [Peronosclerospora sorghi]|uniref:Uncharacterized protein n=1 Tax=Peronosclerospora sorghi TaxID=230839 RepID=A0ACC0VYI1_9STRA|nr:hypothetical protein PsorP6_009357 [Peronosclerospora sorghi]
MISPIGPARNAPRIRRVSPPATILVFCHRLRPPLGVDANPSFQIKPTIALVPDAVKKSTEASHFLTKHHTKVVRTTQPITVAETAKSMIGDTADVELDLLPDLLVMAATRIPSAHKALKSATKPDRVIQVARQSPISMNNAILEQMRNEYCDFQDLAQVLLLNRILAASEPGEDKTSQKKWTKFMGIKLPSKRDDLAACVAPLLNTSLEVPRLVRATKALAFFELMIMCTAPKIFHKDSWLQHCSGLTVAWIPVFQLLHPNMLLALLRTRVGELCLQQWQQTQWHGTLWDDLEYLKNCGFLDLDTAVMQIKVVDERTSLVAGPLIN